MKELKLTPKGDRIIIRPIAPDEKTKGGLHIPVSAKGRPQRGIVVSISEDISNTTLKVGDKGMFSEQSGTEITYDDEKYLIMRITDIIAVEG